MWKKIFYVLIDLLKQIRFSLSPRLSSESPNFYVETYLNTV